MTFAVNSIGHLFGRQRFDTGEGSRNNLVLGYLAMGDGWHNNHHRAPSSARHGFAWYEFDLSYQFIRLLAWLRAGVGREATPARTPGGGGGRAAHDVTLPRTAATGSPAPPFSIRLTLDTAQDRTCGRTGPAPNLRFRFAPGQGRGILPPWRGHPARRGKTHGSAAVPI